MTTFIYNEGGTLYPKQCKFKHLANLEITKKKASIKAFQASAEEVQFRVFTFWNHPPTLGIFMVPRHKLIDINKFGVVLKRCNHTSVWALKVCCIRPW
jgi:hypothetical protein